MELFLDEELWRLVLVMVAPLIFAALGELLMERSGILNVGIEGMMAVAAACAFLVTFKTGSHVLGAAGGMLAGALLASILAYYAISLKCSQLMVGLSLFVLGMGLSSLLYRVVIGIQLSPPTVATLNVLLIPAVHKMPMLGPLFRQNSLVYISLLLIPLLHIFLFKTPIGLRIRAAGESPRALDALGINVFGLRYGATILGGLLIGLAGAYLPLAVTGTYSDGMVGGRGWIALMIVIFGRWSPLSVLGGAVLFAYAEALQFKLALITKAVPPQFLLMLPYLVVIVVLIRVYRGAEPPRALGVAYDRESRV